MPLLTAQDTRAIVHDRAWIALEPRNAQFMFLKEFAQTERGVSFNPSHLGLIQSEGKQQTGRGLSNEQGSGLSLRVREMALTGNYVTTRELLIISSLETMRVAPLHSRPTPAR
jgi:hypothetical protein